MGIITYEQDLVAWANEQARLLRAGRFELIDVEHLAEEIEDVGKSEQRELANRMAILLAHLLKWQKQPERRGTSWTITIRNQRRAIARALEETPSLKGKLTDARWWEAVWGDATDLAARESGLEEFNEVCPWIAAEVLDQNWLP
ncbi:MAG: DUF29 domain-containing protein [Pseudomonadota bacterium]|nr:DUF29 domain-containing protein [Pseudomonadota bacterium]MDP1905385.1 DUF29 domain-containing protein [Pseudomonadota bacterium]MDP2354159.1 DUF29 domain-containing protein [Pseudomonadota bacterium]